MGRDEPAASLVAGAVTFYSLGAHARDRASQIAAVLGVAGLWISVLGCLLGVFFLLASPMPHTREEDLA